jgi:hypothetical protein
LYCDTDRLGLGDQLAGPVRLGPEGWQAACRENEPQNDWPHIGNPSEICAFWAREIIPTSD